MTQNLITTEGVVIRNTPFRERDMIVWVYTYDAGMIKLFVKGKKQHSSICTSPFTRAEFSYVCGRSDLYSLRESRLLDAHHALRKDLGKIEAASALVKALIASQPLGKVAMKMYEMFIWCLQRISYAEEEEKVVSFFMVKTLLHEGRLHLQDSCNACGCGLKEVHIYEGECLCAQHSGTYGALLYSREDIVDMHALAYATTAASFEKGAYSKGLAAGVERLFSCAYEYRNSIV
jgi:DNA repair protein RecO